MPAYDYPFSGGADPIPGWGDRWRFGFGGVWRAGDHWTIEVASADVGNFTIGTGNLNALIPTVCFTYRDRMYLGMGIQFNFSDNDDPTKWEEQDPGAGFIEFLSNFGSQDVVTALSQLQGRLVVFGRRSIQIWTVDADPNNFSLVQTMDNIGTGAPLSAQNVGDFDVLFLDDTGIRSTLTRETTLNAVVDDIGLPIDSLVQTDLLTVAASTACGIVDPSTKRYWLYLNGKIYVLSRYRSSKISAWSTYIPTDNNGTTFTPQKFVVFNGKVYCRGVERGFYTYGGAGGNTYDGTIATIELPWLDDKSPNVTKQGVSVSAAFAGEWKISLGLDPTSGTLTQVLDLGSAASPDENVDSTYDKGSFSNSQLGTHFKLKAQTVAASTKKATFSSVTFNYNRGEKA